mgnify:CR=1 FL=1
MCRHCIAGRGRDPRWLRGLALHGVGLLLCLAVFGFVCMDTLSKAAIASLPLQPAQQRFRCCVLAGRFVQAVGQMPQVGQAPLAVATRQQALWYLLACH